MEIYLVTGNSHKVIEISSVLNEFGISVKQIKEDKHETKDKDIWQVAEENAVHFYKKYKKPIVVDDTGIFFNAFPGFPGNHPKLIFGLLGYRGILKLLENEDRKAEFVTVAGYCDVSGYRHFEGRLECVADTKVNDPDKEVLPYERILMFDGAPLSRYSLDEKNRISHRAQAFRKLGEYLKQKRRQ